MSKMNEPGASFEQAARMVNALGVSLGDAARAFEAFGAAARKLDAEMQAELRRRSVLSRLVGRFKRRRHT